MSGKVVRNLLMSVFLIGFLVPSFSLACNNKIVEEESEMTTKTAPPPIDAYVPTTIETATFALG